MRRVLLLPASLRPVSAWSSVELRPHCPYYHPDWCQSSHLPRKSAVLDVLPSSESQSYECHQDVPARPGFRVVASEHRNLVAARLSRLLEASRPRRCGALRPKNHTLSHRIPARSVSFCFRIEGGMPFDISFSGLPNGPSLPTVCHRAGDVARSFSLTPPLFWRGVGIFAILSMGVPPNLARPQSTFPVNALEARRLRTPIDLIQLL